MNAFKITLTEGVQSTVISRPRRKALPVASLKRQYFYDLLFRKATGFFSLSCPSIMLGIIASLVWAMALDQETSVSGSYPVPHGTP